MDIDRFDVMTRSLTDRAPRRGLLAGLGGSLLALPMLAATGADVDAKKKKKKGKKKKKEPAASSPPPPPPPPPPGQPQAQRAGICGGTIFGTMAPGVGFRSATTFVAERSGTLHQIRVDIVREPETTGDYVVQLVPVTGGEPERFPASVIASSLIDGGTVPTGNFTLVANFAGTSIEAGEDYAVVVARLGGGLLRYPVTFEPNCPDSERFFASGSAAFTADTQGSKLLFSVFVV